MPDYETSRSRLESSLRLGIDVEGGEGNPLVPTVNTLTEDQVQWISSWLAGEGFDRATTTPSDVTTEDDQTPWQLGAPCRACGTWVCAECGHQQLYWSRYRPGTPNCRKCHSPTGELIPVHHRAPMQKRHREWYYGLVETHPCYHPLEQPAP